MRPITTIAIIALLIFTGCAGLKGPDYNVLRRAEQAGAKISDYSVATSPAGDDYLIGVDVSDILMAPTGTTKRFPLSLLPISTAVQAALDAKQDTITVCTVATIPVAPSDGELVIITDGAAPCDTTTGGGAYRSLLQWSDTVLAWVCLSSGASSIDEIQDAAASATIDIGGYTIAYQIGDGGELRIGDISGGAYIEFAKGSARFVGGYYLEASMSLDGADSDGDWAGEHITMTVDGSATHTNFGQVYFIATDGELEAANCSSASTLPAAGFAAEAGTGTKKLLRSGKINKTAWNWIPGQYVYVSSDPATSDGLSQTPPNTSGHYGQIVGVADSADSILIEIHQPVEVP